MSQIQSLPELIGMLRRRAVLIVFIALAGCIASLWFALNQPRAYEATAVIQIESPQVNGEAAGPNAASDATHRLQLIQQRLMARDNLLDVIDAHDLFAGQPDLPTSDRITQLRISTRIDQIREGMESWQPGATPSGLRITVTLGDAQKAADVANAFVEAVMRQNLERRVSTARETLEFFEGEEARITAQIADLEERAAAFKQENAGALPSGISQLRTSLGGLQDTLLEIDRQIVALETGRQRESVAENQLRLLQQQKALVEDRIAGIEASLASAPAVERRFNALTRDLQELQDQLSVITRRRAEAEMSEMLESRQQAERFEVLETALPPAHSVSPSRKKVAMLGGAMSLLAGLGMAFLMEVFNPAIRSAAQLERALDISPVVSIPTVVTRGERRRRTLVWIGGLAVLFAGLPLLLRSLTERFGPLKLLGGN